MEKRKNQKNELRTQLDNLEMIADGLFQDSDDYIQRKMNHDKRQQWSKMLDGVYDSYRNLNYWVFDESQKINPEYQQFHEECNQLYEKLSLLIDQYIKARMGEKVDFSFLKREEKTIKKSLGNVKGWLKN